MASSSLKEVLNSKSSIDKIISSGNLYNKMAETCKTCKEKAESGIFLSPQFADEKVLLFCSEKCKNEYIEEKLERIKSSYPKYYDKLIKNSKSKENKYLFETLQKDKK